MSNIVEQPRHFCALGAQQTVVAIERAIPIIHAGPGCSSKLTGGLSNCNGFQGSGYAGGNAVPCTNSGEREVVFGGEDRLRQLIKNALKIMDGDLFVVLTGCTADLVGDDTEQVVKEFQEQGVPIVYAETGGFKGSNYFGHELVLEAIINQYLKPVEEKIPNLVNVWSVVPYLDPFWSGNLAAIKDLLAGIGLKANIFFGAESGGVEELKKIPAAQFNLILSPWVGLKTGKLLAEKFGTPFLHYPILPIGAYETSRFLKEVAEFAGIKDSIVDAYIQQQETRFYYYLERAADFLLEFRYDLPGRFINISDSFYAIGISKFLVNELGLLPGHQFITDEPSEEHQQSIIEKFTNLANNVSAEITFSPDGGVIQNVLRNIKHRQPPLIIGSVWDKDITAELKGYQISISIPASDRLILDRSYVGYSGGLRLAEDIFTSVLGSYL